MRKTMICIFGITAALPCCVFGQGRTFAAPVPCWRVFRGLPYSAEVTLHTEQTAKDGTPLLHRVATRKVYRDGQGRVRTEEPLQLGAGMPASPLLIVIKDCGAGFEYTLDTRNRVAHRFRIPATGSREAPPVNTSEPKRSMPPSAPQYQSSHENLGTRTIEGVLVDGVMDTLSYPAGTWGYDRPIRTVHEVWTSSELGIIVLSRSSMPAEDIVSRLTNISRLEPDPVLFVIPADYTIVDEHTTFKIE